MAEILSQRPSASWQACVTTIKCDAIEEYVSILVKGDWTSGCTWYKQFKSPDETRKKGKVDKKTRQRIALCQGPQCHRVTDYSDQLLREEQERRTPAEQMSSGSTASP